MYGTLCVQWTKYGLDKYLVDELSDEDDGGDDAGDEADGPDHDIERGEGHPFVAANITHSTSIYKPNAVYVDMYVIVKALTFNRQRIVGLCKSLTLNAVNF